jgi:hypothetical protein
MTIAEIAEFCHEANRMLCLAQGDTSQKFWSMAPEWQKESAINGVRFHLEALEHGEKPSPSASHDNWLKEKIDAGWVYGEIKDPEKKTHPCIVRYDMLPPEQRLKDYMFGHIVAAFYESGLVDVRELDKTPA